MIVFGISFRRCCCRTTKFFEFLRQIMKKIILILIVLILAPYTAYSDSYTHEYIEEQIKRNELPKVCAYMGVGRKKNTRKGQHYRKVYGQDWIHMHHYCWALVDLKRGLHGQAIGNLDYVLRNSKRSFKLRPLVLKKKADILMFIKAYSEAAPVYYELIKVKPESEIGYVGLATVFLTLGDKKNARKIAQKGLSYLPDSKKLQSFLKK